jgi:hypothetical protein
MREKNEEEGNKVKDGERRMNFCIRICEVNFSCVFDDSAS